MNAATDLTKDEIEEIFPQIAGRYKFLGRRPIGRPSGFGVVWRARDKWLDQEVAIKISANDLKEEIVFCRDIIGQTIRIFDYFRGEGDWNAYTMELLKSPWISLASFIENTSIKTTIYSIILIVSKSLEAL